MTNDVYSHFLAKRSSELNQHIEDLKKLESYAVCAKDTLAYMQKFVDSQSSELQALYSSEKITKETHNVSHDVLRNVLQTLKTVEEESLKNYYTKLGAADFIKKDMTDLVNSRALAQEKELEESIASSEDQK